MLGGEGVREIFSDWLTFLHLIPLIIPLFRKYVHLGLAINGNQFQETDLSLNFSSFSIRVLYFYSHLSSVVCFSVGC